MTASEILLPSIAMGPSQQQQHTAAASVMNGHGPEAEYIAVDRSDQGFTFSPAQEALFEEQESLAIVQELTASSEWHEVKAYGHMSDTAREVSLTATTLRGDGKIALRPLKFFNHDKTECVIVMHLGRNLCGHAGIIHGGMLGTLLDEHLAYVSLPSLPNYTGFTANLSVDYRKPCKADQWVVIRGKLDRVEGRKAYAHARVETAIDHTLLTEATALYISPRTAGPLKEGQP
ncbi:HotDog domain-containing protein [Zychaea mexicana]|uniref:HotDog domain-containing protein n=1 Tax=Zychaea mexicana TaxID=64656 RepID=UPI0022FDF740|nr:HotDog domain-containing protein [Zychaea mexicana]KAI9491648.1 HotDog domain-containing protein [Zychaea mexicana]